MTLKTQILWKAWRYFHLYDSLILYLQFRNSITHMTQSNVHFFILNSTILWYLIFFNSTPLTTLMRTEQFSRFFSFLQKFVKKAKFYIYLLITSSCMVALLKQNIEIKNVLVPGSFRFVNSYCQVVLYHF